METYVKPTAGVSPAPQGVNPPNIYDNQRVLQAYNGDTVQIVTQVLLQDGTPVTEENAILEFVLADDRFTQPIWLGKWRNGIESRGNGLIEIRIPNKVTATLRRGSFSYSLLVTDKLNDIRNTTLEGTLLVEYAPTSPTQSIPYKDCPPLNYVPEGCDC